MNRDKLHEALSNSGFHISERMLGDNLGSQLIFIEDKKGVVWIIQNDNSICLNTHDMEEIIEALKK